jgi:hypothetical protein
MRQNEKMFRVTAITMITWLLSSFLFPSIAIAKEVEIPFGTVVPLRVEEAIHPATHTVGQQVVFIVDRDVVVDDEIVIAAGSAAFGEITQSTKKGSVGKPAVIGVTVNHVLAVDGTAIALKGAKLVEGESKQTSSLVFTLLCCILALMMQGDDAEIIAGSSINAEVYGNFSVEI